MAYTFYRNGMHEDHTAFELYFRKCPFGGSYCIFAGLKEAIHYVQSFKFTKEEVEYLKRYFVITNLAQSFLPMPTRSSLIIY
jgi:nicotinate phosphoribosyltransferase